MSRYFVCATTLISTALLLSACGGEKSQSNTTASSDIATSNCFWQGPYSIDNPASNFAYPDSGAIYWSTRYQLPAGATLQLNGKFPHARYMSLNSYQEIAGTYVPVDSIADSAIIPDQGATNPFINGNARNNDERSYSLTIAAGTAPEPRADNTIYDTVNDEQAVLLYRIYVPDQGKSITGGVQLPEPVLTLNGQQYTGQAACDELKNVQGLESIPLVPAQQYAAATKNPANILGDMNPNPQPVWKAAYNFVYSIQCNFFGACFDLGTNTKPERHVGWFANLDNQYMAAYLDRSIKPVVVIRGQLPEVPETLNGDEVFNSDNAQLRYWSICQNEYYSQKVSACLYDEQITINPDGKYTIVTSRAADRPSNATEQCGIGFLPMSESGDGFGDMVAGQVNDTDATMLLIRNMLPMNGFANTIQNTSTPGDEAAVLGDYMPSATYYTVEEFEALGCDAYTAL